MLSKSLLNISSRSLGSLAAGGKLVLPDLPYEFSALEPVISSKIMQIHHSKHHAAYVNNFNLLLPQYQEAESKGDLSKMIALQPGLRFNGGGHINHSIFWQNLAPISKGGGGLPTGKLADAINKEFGSFDAFKTKFNTQTAAVQGSGWGWLGYNPATCRIQITTLANQDPLSTVGQVPLLGIDVWEHAYYLDYLNVRPDYLKAIWGIINWADVGKRYEAAIKN